MKKLFLIIFTFFVSALIVGAMPLAYAAETIKIYYSEPMGGTKVYHIEACQKMRAYQVVKCETPANNSPYGAQCDKDDDKGKPIQGCKILEDAGDASKGFKKNPGTTYYNVDIGQFNRTKGKCSDNDGNDHEDRVAFRYEPLWILMPAGSTNEAKKDMSNKKGEIIGGTLGTPPLDRPNGLEGTEAVEMYAIGSCATWDRLDSNGAPGTAEIDPKVQALIDRLKEDYGVDLIAAAEGIVTSGCNKTLHSNPLDPAASVTCSYVERLEGNSGSDLFGRYISLLYKWAAGIIGIIAVLTFVYNGIKISTAGGNASAVEEARDAILKALAAMAILFLSGLILYTINPTFFVS